NRAVFEGLRVLDKRQGFRPIKDNVLAQKGELATYTHPTWSKPPLVGRLRFGLATEVTRKSAVVKLGDYLAHLGPEAIDWTAKSSLTQVLKVGDVAPYLIQGVDEAKKELKVKLDQVPLVEGTLRQAMEESRNIVAVKLLNEVGYQKTIDLARSMGISSPLQPYPSMALGTMEVSLIDLTSAYSIFPNQGVRVDPHLIRDVADRE